MTWIFSNTAVHTPNTKSHVRLLISVRYSLGLHCVALGDIFDIDRELHSLQFLTSECSVQVTACGFHSNMVLQYNITNEYCSENLKNHSIPNVMTSKKKIQVFKNNYIYIFILWKDNEVLTLLVTTTHNTKDNITHFTESIKSLSNNLFTTAKKHEITCCYIL